MVDMPRRSGIDAAGALHHVMVRGIERGEGTQGIEGVSEE